MSTKTKLKYKAGDRVVYRCDGTGNPDLHGRHGKIIGTDRSHSPYTVQFDEEFLDAMEDMRFGGKKGHCWCCTESHLEKEDGGADDGSSDHRINEKGETTMAVVCISKWTKEQDEKLLAMKAEGKTSNEMAVEINKTVEQCDQKTAEQCYQRLYYLKKVKGKYGVTAKAEPDTGAAEKAETTPQPEGLTHSEEPLEEEQEGELNDLEKVLAETITEQKAEIYRLKEAVIEFQNKLGDANVDKNDLASAIISLEEDKAKLVRELDDTKTALAQTETQLDVEVEALRSAAAELEKAKAVEDDFKSMVESYAAETAEYKKRLAEVDAKYEKIVSGLSGIIHGKDSCIEQLEAENKRLLKLIVGLTEERLANHAS